MKKLGLFILANLLLAGCANSPVSHVGIFAQSAEEVAGSMLKVLDEVNESSVVQRKASLATKNQQIPDGAFEGAFEDSEGFRHRIEAVSSLKNYSSALARLASANFREDIDKASADLYGSLSGINISIAILGGTSGLINDGIIKGIATVIDAIGATIVEKQRFLALQKIVTSADPSIQKISALVVDDLDGLSEEISINADSIYTDSVTAYFGEFDVLSYAERLKKLDELDVMAHRVVQAPKVVDQLGISAIQMGKAHAKLSEALKMGKYSTLDTIKEIGQLQQESEKLKTFYISLESH